MKILFLTFYYKPDLCAGSFRSQSLIKALNEAITPHDEVTLLTTMPQRYQSFIVDAQASEYDGRVKVERFKIPVHNSGFVDQIKSFYSFYKQVLNYTKKENYDVVFATSSRLFTAFLGARIARKKKATLLLDMRDIFRDSLKSLLPKLTFVLLNLPLIMVERYTFSYAKKINLVSDGFNSYFKKRYPKVQFSNFYNGVDDVFFNYDYSKNISSEKKIITYAGNIGQGQGIEIIIPQIAEYLGDKYEFHIYGDGGQRPQLEYILQREQLDNVKLFSPIDRNELLEIYKNSDFLFLHLNDFPAFKKVLPSKIFEYAITNKKIIAGVNGFARDFIIKNLPAAIVFDSGSITSFIEAFKLSQSSDLKFDSKEFVQRFRRERISKEMVSVMFGLNKV